MMKQNNDETVFIRPGRPEDRGAVRAVNLAAFQTTGEADVVDLLREGCPRFISLVAEVRGQVVGHVLFTPVTLTADDGQALAGMGLAPLAVLPDFQNAGVGTALVKAGMAQMEVEGVPFVVVLGHPDYYPRFGFGVAARFGLRCAYPDVPEEAFMVRIFDEAALTGMQGVVHYRPEFDPVS
jgi:putative acetyltransferase